MNIKKILPIFLSMFICFSVAAQEVDDNKIEKLIEEIEDLREELDELKEKVKEDAAKIDTLKVKEEVKSNEATEREKKKKGDGKVILLSFNL